MLKKIGGSLMLGLLLLASPKTWAGYSPTIQGKLIGRTLKDITVEDKKGKRYTVPHGGFIAKKDLAKLKNNPGGKYQTFKIILSPKVAKANIKNVSKKARR